MKLKISLFYVNKASISGYTSATPQHSSLFAARTLGPINMSSLHFPRSQTPVSSYNNSSLGSHVNSLSRFQRSYLFVINQKIVFRLFGIVLRFARNLEVQARVARATLIQAEYLNLELFQVHFPLEASTRIVCPTV